MSVYNANAPVHAYGETKMRRATFYHGLSLGLLLGVALTLPGTGKTGKTRFSSSLTFGSPLNSCSYFSEGVTMPSEPTKSPRYKAIDLGLPEGCVSIEAKAASPDFRYIVGTAQTRTVKRAFVWKDGAYQYLSSKDAIAWSVNNFGKVAGETITDAETSCAVAWNGGKMERLFQDKSSSIAQGTDNKGNVYGIRVDPSSGHVWRTFLRSSNGSTVYFDAKSQRNSFFRCVNEKQQVVITLSPRSVGEEKVVVWKQKRMRDLPPLQPKQRCRPQGSNEKGDVVGICWLGGVNPMPVVWKNYKPSLLATPTIQAGEATAINAKGDVIGMVSLKGAGMDTPFLFRQGKFFEMNTLITNSVTVRRPIQISDDGKVLASGVVGNESHIFLLEPQ